MSLPIPEDSLTSATPIPARAVPGAREVARRAAVASFLPAAETLAATFAAPLRYVATLCDAPAAFLAFDDGEHLLVGAAHGAVPARLPRFLPRRRGRRHPIFVVADPPAAGADAGPPFRFVAGAPLVDAEGHRIGALCVADPAPRAPLPPTAAAGLAVLAGQVMAQLALARQLRRQDTAWARLETALDLLRPSGALLNAVLESLPVGVLITDAKGRTVRANAAHRAFWRSDRPAGRRPDDRGWQGVWPKTGRRIARSEWPLARALRARETVRGELLELHPRDGGPRRHSLTSAAPVCDAQGRLLGAVAIEHDVTDAIFADRRLRETEERFRLALGATRDAIWDWDLERDEVVWNEAVTMLFGYDPAAIGPSMAWWRARVHPDDRRRAEEERRDAIAGTGTGWSAEYRFLRADGSYAHVLDRGTLLRDAGGRATRAIGAMLDLSERKAAETELARAHEDLLRVSRLDAMGAVAGTLAHELNQPLTASMNFIAALKLRLAELADAGDGLVRLVDRASGELLRAGEIVRRIRRFASTGELSRRTEPLADMVERAWRSVRQLPAAQAIVPVVAIAADAGAVEADRVQMEQVIGNLLKNAVEAMDGRPAPYLAVSARRRGGRIEIAICDSGPGLGPEERAHLFEPFRSSKPNGMGLGLPLCRTIVEAHGGQIAAEARPGGGTCFRITLPAPVED